MSKYIDDKHTGLSCDTFFITSIDPPTTRNGKTSFRINSSVKPYITDVFLTNPDSHPSDLTQIYYDLLSKLGKGP